MKSTYTHKFTLVHKSAKGGFTRENAPNKEAPMYEGSLAARDMALDNDCDVAHSAYNAELHKWVYLGTFHPDGTCTQWTGERLRFVENPVRPWAKIEQ